MFHKDVASQTFGPLMISIRKCIGSLEEADRRNGAVVRACAALVRSLQAAIELLGAAPSAALKQPIESIRLELEQGSPSESLEQHASSLEQEFVRSTRETASSLSQKEREYKKMIKMLAEVATTLSESGSVRSRQLQQLTSEIESASRLNNIIDLRKQLSQQVVELRAVASQIEEDGRSRAKKLEKEVEAVTVRLSLAESAAGTDTLTSLGNRRRLEKEVQSAATLNQPFCLILFDLDGFKPVNDKHGHKQGDQLLKAVAQGLKLAVRTGDVLCRWGGDEFAILVQNCRLADAAKLADRIEIKAFGEFLIENVGRKTRVTVGASWGAAEFGPMDTPEQLFERADQMLYERKNERKNRQLKPFPVPAGRADEPGMLPSSKAAS